MQVVHRGAAAAQERDLLACRDLMRHHGRSFWFAFSFLPRELRDDVAVVYAYYRTIDNIVDRPIPGQSASSLLAMLSDWDDWLAKGAEPEDSGPIRRALPAVIRRRALSVDDLRIVLSGQRTDVEYRSMETMGQLEEYSFAVAGSVGVVLARLLGADDNAREPAASLGIAMQLTNICRDVAEDLDRGRIYLPRDVCALSGCDDAMIEARVSTEPVRAAVRALGRRARDLYVEGREVVHQFPRPAGFSVAVAARAYEGILDRLEARNYDVFAGRVAAGRFTRWRVAAQVAGGGLHWAHPRWEPAPSPEHPPAEPAEADRHHR